jgi:two-component system cell cycle response regulator DivK
VTIDDHPEGAAPCRGVVLIADDTADTRDLYCLYLTSRGFKVVTAKDGEAAVDVALRHRPDVVVIDFAMPRLDGMAAIQRLKTDSRTRYTPIVMLTAHPLKAAQGGSLQASVDSFLTKPCLPEHLEQHIDSLMSASKASGSLTRCCPSP